MTPVAGVPVGLPAAWSSRCLVHQARASRRSPERADCLTPVSAFAVCGGGRR